MVAPSHQCLRGKKKKKETWHVCPKSCVYSHTGAGRFPGEGMYMKVFERFPGARQSSPPCIAAERGKQREPHSASCPITRLRVALKPIGSTQPRLKIDNRSESSRESKALLENSAPIFVSSLTAFISEKKRFKRRICTVPVKKKVCCYYAVSVFMWRIIQCYVIVLKIIYCGFVCYVWLYFAVFDRRFIDYVSGAVCWMLLCGEWMVHVGWTWGGQHGKCSVCTDVCLVHAATHPLPTHLWRLGVQDREKPHGKGKEIAGLSGRDFIFRLHEEIMFVWLKENSQE